MATQFTFVRNEKSNLDFVRSRDGKVFGVVHQILRAGEMTNAAIDLAQSTANVTGEEIGAILPGRLEQSIFHPQTKAIGFWFFRNTAGDYHLLRRSNGEDFGSFSPAGVPSAVIREAKRLAQSAADRLKLDVKVVLPWDSGDTIFRPAGQGESDTELAPPDFFYPSVASASTPAAPVPEAPKPKLAAEADALEVRLASYNGAKTPADSVEANLHLASERGLDPAVVRVLAFTVLEVRVQSLIDKNLATRENARAAALAKANKRGGLVRLVVDALDPALDDKRTPEQSARVAELREEFDRIARRLRAEPTLGRPPVPPKAVARGQKGRAW